MSEYKVKLKKTWEDETLLELNMIVTSPHCKANIYFHTTIEDLKQLKDNLILFSNLKRKEYQWIQGEDKESAAHYVQVRFFHFNNQGHIGVEFVLDNKLDIPDRTRVNFYLVTELNQIDDFIYKLEGLIKGITDSLESISEARV
ncbi:MULTISPECIES: hypothetical protein [Priestia]|uniref:hypothetical protein n=1 Tax=Priestia TaxID=2800373 RepID=UPI00064EBA86|nr:MULTISPECIES: hypothetical protein [Priestia]AWD68619.1 hypothetical protein C2I28_26665 [Priestia megaterium]KML24514.1 hypothetical protein VL11_26020 [Priestia aryabhattai]KMN98184.1 hypothetical protein ABV89_18505 [Priestia aryabhattai]NLR46340.1 hypothetical protein [Priestia megaterium]